MVYGYPGSGKTYFARQFCENFNCAHIQADRIRYELFDQPKYTQDENVVIDHLMSYMSEEFIRAGISVVYDTDVYTKQSRKKLNEMSKKLGTEALLVWLQIDIESAFTRVAKRDRRKIDDKFTRQLDRTSFESIISKMQNPVASECVVLSGKHHFSSQRNTILKKLLEQNIISSETAHSDLVKPELVNLVPAGRVDMSRRNIFIR